MWAIHQYKTHHWFGMLSVIVRTPSAASQCCHAPAHRPFLHVLHLVDKGFQFTIVCLTFITYLSYQQLSTSIGRTGWLQKGGVGHSVMIHALATKCLLKYKSQYIKASGFTHTWSQGQMTVVLATMGMAKARPNYSSIIKNLPSFTLSAQLRWDEGEVLLWQICHHLFLGKC